MKKGDLVKIEGEMINGYTWVMPYLGIYVKLVDHNHMSYSPAFPTCEILTSRGLKIVRMERIHLVL
jgi:hypothetical protein